MIDLIKRSRLTYFISTLLHDGPLSTEDIWNILKQQDNTLSCEDVSLILKQMVAFHGDIGITSDGYYQKLEVPKQFDHVPVPEKNSCSICKHWYEVQPIPGVDEISAGLCLNGVYIPGKLINTLDMMPVSVNLIYSGRDACCSKFEVYKEDA